MGTCGQETQFRSRPALVDDLDTSARNWALHALAGSQDSAAVHARRFIVLNEHEAPLRVTALQQMTHDATPVAVGIVRSALRDPDAGVRSQALRTLQTLDASGLSQRALVMYRHDPSSSVRAQALVEYARGDIAAALPTVIDASGPSHPLDIRQAAVRVFDRAGKRPGVADALERLTDPSEVRGLRGAGLNGLFAIGDTTRAIAAAAKGLQDYDPLYAQAAVGALARLGTPAARAKLQEALAKETRVHVKDAIERALARR